MEGREREGGERDRKRTEGWERRWKGGRGVANGLSRIMNLCKFKASLRISALKKASRNLGLTRNRTVSESENFESRKCSFFYTLFSQSFGSLRLGLGFLER